MWHRHPTCIALGVTYSFSIRLSAPCTNNLVEYEAVHRGMELLVEAGAEAVEVFGDSKLVISQLTKEYRYLNFY
jgi:ribonuclease HI